MADVVKETKLNNTRKSLVKFFKEVKNELKKVVWPTRTQLTNNTVTVLLTCFLVGAIIWIIDAGLLIATERLFIK